MYKWDDWRHASHMYTHNNPIKKTRTHWLRQILSQKKCCDSDWIILTASWVGLHIKLEGKMKKTIAFLQASPTAILPHPIFSPFTRSSSPFPLLWMPATQVIFTCKNAFITVFFQLRLQKILLHVPWKRRPWKCRLWKHRPQKCKPWKCWPFTDW